MPLSPVTPDAPLPEVCVCYLIAADSSGDRVLLGRKKFGLGEGNLVGPGGKLEPGETPAEAMVREIAEETSVRVRSEDLQLVGELSYVFAHKPAWSQKSWVFVCRVFSGEPQESAELSPEWFPLDAIPTERMWHDARFWLADALAGRFVTARFDFGADLRTVVASDHPGFAPAPPSAIAG